MPKPKRANPAPASPDRPPAEAVDAAAGSRNPPKRVKVERRGIRGETVWALLTGLAVGFAVGREVGGCDHTPSSASGAATTEGTASALPSRATYRSVSEFPAGWIKDGDIKSDVLAGLNDQQKALALQALNERNCECGCPFGTLANCLAKDPHCPRSPVLARVAVDAVKAGKDLAGVLAEVDARQAAMGKGAPAAGAPPTGPVHVAVNSYNARKGPWPAKVTLIVFSDFQ